MSTTQSTPSGVSHNSFDDRGIRPIQPIDPPPRSTAVAKFAERLERELSHSPEAAAAIAEAVEDPRIAREQTSRLARIPVRGGTLYSLDVRVNALRLIVDPINPRTIGATDYPASSTRTARAKYWGPRDLTTDPGRPTELRLRGGSRQDVMDALDDAKGVLRDHNPLSESIAANGVFFPVIAMPWLIVTDDGPPVAALVTRDGSSRLNGAQENLGVAPFDPIYGPVSDPRRSRSIVKEISELVQKSQDEISNAQAARAHSLMIPARIIVAYEPDPGSEDDLLDVVDELVALIHLDRPTPWSPPSEANKRSDIVLGELVEERQLSRRQAEYFAGMLDRSNARADGLTVFPDERAAEILKYFTTSTQTPVGKAISRGIRGLTRAGRVSKEDKAKIFTPLILRGHHFASANLRKSAESTLPRAYTMSGFWDHRWSVTGRTPEELRDAALKELHEGHPAQSALELAVLGSYWLGVHGGLGRESFGQSSGGERDHRSPSAVLNTVMSSPRGIHLLYQAVVDGRGGEPPTRVDENGEVAPDGTGQVPTVTNAWLRETFPTNVAKPKTGPPPASNGTTSAEHLQQAVRNVRWRMSELAQQVEGLRNIVGGGGVPLVDEGGIPQTDVQAITEEYNLRIAPNLYAWGGIHQARQSVIHTQYDTASDDDGVVGHPSGSKDGTGAMKDEALEDEYADSAPGVDSSEEE
jgi:hypothetical protein